MIGFIRLGAATLALVLPVSLGRADENKSSVEWLYRACDNQLGLMQGYCAGFLDALTTRLNMTGAICSPQGSTLGEAILSFQKWAADHPDQWQINAQLGVEAALKSTWSCK